MSESIKASEVSDVLRMQLEGIDTKLRFDEVGTVLQVSDGVVRVYGLQNAEANELLEFENGIRAVVMNLEEDNVGAVLLGPTDQIKEGDTVKRTRRIASINVSEGMLGRVIDPLGEPLDGLGLIGGETTEMPLERKAPGVIFRQPVNQPLQTGLKAVDAMIPIGRGQRELIIGDRQTGKCDRYDTQPAQQLRGRRSDLLHLRGDRAERFDGGDDRQHAARAGRDGLYGRRGRYGVRSGRDAILRAVRRCRYRRVFPRYGAACAGRIRRPVETGGRLSGGIADSASSVGTRGLSGRYLLPALPSVGARGQDYRPAGSGREDERPA